MPWLEADARRHGIRSGAHPVEVRHTKGVPLRLMYEPGLDPPFVVFSAMPKREGPG
ncbi:hypothetical protein [Streptomyces sp. NPDC056921]|uniref:hypothetical protein n=1 Tax=Streptomyces sp. NPDC056921 TaxID=3345966 RepID=UPI003632757B